MGDFSVKWLRCGFGYLDEDVILQYSQGIVPACERMLVIKSLEMWLSSDIAILKPFSKHLQLTNHD